MFSYDFRLAGRVIRLEHCHQIKLNENFLPFRVFDQEPDCVITFRERSELEFFSSDPLYSNINFYVFKDRDGFTRQYIDYKDNRIPYALSKISSDGTTEEVVYLPQFAWAFSESQNSFSHTAIDELLIHFDRVILHASFIAADFGGILFSGPSGIGKSTQAKLWADLEGSEIINGDRPIIGKENGVWRAWGSPYAGSSGYHVAKDIPIKAIVVLRQSSENRIERLSTATAFKHLFSEMTVNSWNPRYTNRVIDLTSDLADSLPIYRLWCKPDASAVGTLKEKLLQEDAEWIFGK